MNRGRHYVLYWESRFRRVRRMCSNCSMRYDRKSNTAIGGKKGHNALWSMHIFQTHRGCFKMAIERIKRSQLAGKIWFAKNRIEIRFVDFFIMIQNIFFGKSRTAKHTTYQEKIKKIPKFWSETSSRMQKTTMTTRHFSNPSPPPPPAPPTCLVIIYGQPAIRQELITGFRLLYFRNTLNMKFNLEFNVSLISTKSAIIS